MIRKSTYSLLLILLILMAVVVFLQRTPGLIAKTDSLPTSTESPLLLNMGTKTVSAFTMTDDQGHVLITHLDDQQTWFVDQPSVCQYDANKISYTVSILQTLKVLVSLEVPPAIADVGLLNPTYQMDLTFDDGSTQTLSIGSIVPIGSGYYVQVNNNPVVVVSKTSIDSLFTLISTACATSTPEASATMQETLQSNVTLEVLTPAP